MKKNKTKVKTSAERSARRSGKNNRTLQKRRNSRVGKKEPYYDFVRVMFPALHLEQNPKTREMVAEFDRMFFDAFTSFVETGFAYDPRRLDVLKSEDLDGRTVKTIKTKGG